MMKPSSMPKVLDMAALVVVGINVPFAVYGYLLFGENTQGMYVWTGPGKLANYCVYRLCVLKSPWKLV